MATDTTNGAASDDVAPCGALWSIWHHEDPWPDRAYRSTDEQSRNCIPEPGHEGRAHRQYRHPTRVTLHGLEWSKPHA